MASQLETIAALIPGVVWIMDMREQRYVYVNPGAERLLGYPAEQYYQGGAQWIMSRIHPDDLKRVIERNNHAMAEIVKQSPDVQERYVHEDEYRLQHKDGHWVWLKSSGIAYSHDPDGTIREVLGIAIDITREKEGEAQLRLSEKLASAGLLAAEIAHEINNPLAFVTMSIEMALEKLKAALRLGGKKENPRIHEAAEILEKAHRNADRISKIIRHLKTFSRTDDESMGVVDVHQAIEFALPLLQTEFSSRAKLFKHYASVPPVVGSESRLSQVFLNLLLNAVQSFPEHDLKRNRVEIRTRLDAGGWVVVEIKDNGQGIAAQNLQTIFDPFFTTRPIGIGTGLGLSISQNIVKSVGGRIDVTSTVGQGTTFQVYLKIASDPSQEA